MNPPPRLVPIPPRELGRRSDCFLATNEDIPHGETLWWLDTQECAPLTVSVPICDRCAQQLVRAGKALGPED